MKTFIAFLAILMMFPMYSFADRNGEQQVFPHHKKSKLDILSITKWRTCPMLSIMTASLGKSSLRLTAHPYVMYPSSF